MKNLLPADFSIILSGLSVYFNAPPVLISGVFIIDSTPDYEAYKGGLAVSLMPYSLLAVGEYQHIFSNDQKSVFIFGRLDGPLFTLEFAEISGVEVGTYHQYNCRANASKLTLLSGFGKCAELFVGISRINIAF